MSAEFGPAGRVQRDPMPWLVAHGEMADRVRAHAWDRTPLGPPSRWSPELRALVKVMLASAQPMFVTWGAERTMLYNDGYAPMCGAKHPAALGQPFDVVWSDILADVGPIVDRTYAGESIRMDHIELMMQDRRGQPEEAHFAFSYTPVRDDGGAIVGMFCECREITAEVLAQRQAAQVAARERAYLDRQRLLLTLSDALRPLADPVEVQATAARVLGEHLGADRAFYCEVAADGDEFRVHRHYTARGNAPFTGTFRISEFGDFLLGEYRAGRTVVISDTATDPRLEAAERRRFERVGARAAIGVPMIKRGRLVAIVAANQARPRDWTPEEAACVEETAERTWSAVEWARAQAELRESEARFRRMADHAPVMIRVTEPDGRCTFLNSGWYAFTGQSPAGALGFRWLEVVHPEDRPAAEARFREALQERAAFQAEYRVRRSDGAYRWVIDAAAPRFGDDGSFQGYVGSVLDISDRKEIERALHEADRQKNEFLAMLAHELRNPLAPIRMAGELLARTVRDPHPTAVKAVGMVQRQVSQLSRLVDDLLDVSRITQGRIDLQLDVLDVAEVVAEAIETVEPMVRDKRQVLTWHELAGSSAPWVRADRTRLIQCLVNLLANASKYTDADGRIDVRCHVENECAVVAVADTGAGIPPELLPRVFDLFLQAERTLDRAQGGLGVGLSVVRRLMDMHGGTVTAASPGVGRGSTFTLRLPLVEPPASRETPPAAQRASRRRVLVVDDNVDAADALVMRLALDGHDARAAYGGGEVLQVVADFRPEVVLLDVGMPQIDGYELARRLRNGPRARDLHLLALTGYGQPADRERALRAGFDDHLVKPVDPARLDAAIAAAPRRV